MLKLVPCFVVTYYVSNIKLMSEEQHMHNEINPNPILKELRSLPPSSMCTLWTLLRNLSIPDVPLPVLLSTLIRSRFQAKPATLLIPIDFSFPFSRWRSFTVLGTKVAPFPYLKWGVVSTACVAFLFLFIKTLKPSRLPPFLGNMGKRGGL